MARVSVAWQNWPGSPGVSQFFFTVPIDQTDVDGVRTFFDAVKAQIPAGISITVPSSGDIVNDADGKLAGTWSVGTAPLVVTGTGPGGYAGNAGAVCHWLTQTVAKNRRIRGRTFLVPLIGSAFDTTGSLSSTALTLLQNAAAALVVGGTGTMVVWHRPVVQKGTGTILAAGGSAPVTSSRVPDLAISLRSRRV